MQSSHAAGKPLILVLASSIMCFAMYMHNIACVIAHVNIIYVNIVHVFPKLYSFPQASHCNSMARVPSC